MFQVYNQLVKGTKVQIIMYDYIGGFNFCIEEMYQLLGYQEKLTLALVNYRLVKVNSDNFYL